MLLHAFLKSNFRNTWPGWRLFRNRRVAWTAASMLFGVLYPNWLFVKSSPMAFMMCLPAGLVASRRRVQPTAIGLTLLTHSLSSAVREEPKKNGQTALGVLPCRMTFTKDVRALSSSGLPPSAEVPVMSLMCWGVRPSGPPADPFGKEQIASATAFSEIDVSIVLVQLNLFYCFVEKEVLED